MRKAYINKLNQVAFLGLHASNVSLHSSESQFAIAEEEEVNNKAFFS